MTAERSRPRPRRGGERRWNRESDARRDLHALVLRCGVRDGRGGGREDEGGEQHGGVLRGEGRGCGSSGVRSVSPRPVGAASHFVICPVRTRRGAMNHSLLACCSHTSDTSRRIAGLQALLAENRQLGRAEALQGSACARYPTPGS